MKNIISTTEAPAAIGAYSQAVVANGMLFASGQLGIDPATGDFAGEDFRSQAEHTISHYGLTISTDSCWCFGSRNNLFHINNFVL